MYNKENNGILFIRLFPNENIIEKIKECCKKNNIRSGVIISGIGQLKKFKIGYFKEKNNYYPNFYIEPHELLSLSGNICLNNDKYEIHLHAVLGDQEKQLVGGHLLDGFVEITNEIIIIKTEVFFKRRINNETGLKEMFFD